MVLLFLLEYLYDSDHKGTVRVFEYNNNDWSQIGSDIDGPSYSEFGWSSSLSSDGTIIAIGGVRYDSYNGIVRVYKYLNNSWSQLGSDIVGNSSRWRCISYFWWCISYL